MLVVSVAALGCTLKGVGVSPRRLRRSGETPLDIVVVTGAALAATLAILVGYSYGRHLATG